MGFGRRFSSKALAHLGRRQTKATVPYMNIPEVSVKYFGVKERSPAGSRDRITVSAKAGVVDAPATRLAFVSPAEPPPTPVPTTVLSAAAADSTYD